MTCPKLVKLNKKSPFRLVYSQQNDYQFSAAQSQQNDQFENLHISSHGEARNIKLGQENLNSKGSIGYSTSGGSGVITS